MLTLRAHDVMPQGGIYPQLAATALTFSGGQLPRTHGHSHKWVPAAGAGWVSQDADLPVRPGKWLQSYQCCRREAWAGSRPHAHDVLLQAAVYAATAITSKVDVLGPVTSWQTLILILHLKITSGKGHPPRITALCSAKPTLRPLGGVILTRSQNSPP